MSTSHPTPSHGKTLGRETLDQYHRNWLAWPTDRIGESLYGLAFPAERPHVQRAGSFALDKDQLEILKSEGLKASYLTVHFTSWIEPEAHNRTLADPGFLPVLELTGTDILLPMAWAPEDLMDNVGSEPIAKATAELFCHAYCNLPARELGSIFEAPIGRTVFRANSADFRSGKDIPEAERTEALIKSKLPHVESCCFDLGVATPIPNHPYRFRPILRLRGKDSESGSLSYFDLAADVAFICPPCCWGLC